MNKKQLLLPILILFLISHSTTTEYLANATQGKIGNNPKEDPKAYGISFDDNEERGAVAENDYVGAFDNDELVEVFANRFKEAVANKEKGTVASMIEYPLYDTFGDKEIIINNEKEFLELYDDIFDDDLYRKIADANTHNMFTNYKGAMLGSGEVWFGGKRNDIKVIKVGGCIRYFSETFDEWCQKRDQEDIQKALDILEKTRWVD